MQCGFETKYLHHLKKNQSTLETDIGENK